MSSKTTLAELVLAHPAAARVFHRHRLDFCCGGQRPMEEACAEVGLDPQGMLAEIQAAGGVDSAVRLADWSAGELIEHIIRRYHVPLREEVPRLCALARRVERVHHEKPDCPHGLADHLEDMREAVEAHLDKEEQILFPMIRAGQGHVAHMPVQVMVQEHHDHAANLERVRRLTHDLRLPDSACATWQALYRGLADLELELMEHIHLENNVLFPEVLAR